MNPVTRRRFLHAPTALGISALCPTMGVASQAWPSKPLRLVVPVPPGGSLDLLARTVARELGPRLGQAVTVENQGGAGGNIAFGAVASAPADGYTLLLGWDSLAINPALYPNVPYRLNQFAPVTLAITSPQVLVAHPARVPGGSLSDFLAQARKRRGAVTVASPGNGSPGHLSIAHLESLAGIDVLHVPYKGGGPALADLLAGHVDAAMVTLPAAIQHIRSGRLVALGVSSKTRSSGAPAIPTLSEAGVAGYDLNSWQGFFVPAGSPSEAIGRLNREISEVLRGREVREQLTQQGFEVLAAGPESLSRELQEGAPRWARLVRDSGAKVD